MAKSLPFVLTSDKLKVATLHHWQGDDLAEIALDSPDWFRWLEQGFSFRVTYNRQGKSVSYNVQPDRRGEKLYFSGFRRVGGKLGKKYLGASGKLTQAKLNAAGAHFLDLIQSQSDYDETAPLLEAIADYEALINQLMPHLPSHLRRLTRNEAGRIKDNLGNK